MTDDAASGLVEAPVDDLNESLPTEPGERKRVLNVLAQRRYRKPPSESSEAS
jgi:hypothetical protein